MFIYLFVCILQIKELRAQLARAKRGKDLAELAETKHKIAVELKELEKTGVPHGTPPTGDPPVLTGAPNPTGLSAHPTGVPSESGVPARPTGPSSHTGVQLAQRALSGVSANPADPPPHAGAPPAPLAHSTWSPPAHGADSHHHHAPQHDQWWYAATVTGAHATAPPHFPVALGAVANAAPGAYSAPQHFAAHPGASPHAWAGTYGAPPHFAVTHGAAPHAAQAAYAGAPHFAVAPGTAHHVYPPAYASPPYATIPAFPGSSQVGVETLARAYHDAERRVQERDLRLLQIQGLLSTMLGSQQPPRPYGP